MNAAAPLRLGFVGGSLESAIGYTHFVASRMDGMFRIEAGCFDRVEAANRATAAHYGVGEDRTYATWDALAGNERGKLDAVIVLTPTPTHAEIVAGVLNAGYPVICEKALATSSAECGGIRNALAKNNGFLAVTFNYSGYPMVRELRRWIAEGELGRIQQILVEMPQEGFLRTSPAGEPASPQPWRLADINIPTVSLDLGVHVHHLVHFLVPGSRPLELVADQTRFGHFDDIVDNVFCFARYSGDLRVQMWYGKTALGNRNGLRFRVYGDRGSAEWLQAEAEVLRIWKRDGSGLLFDRSMATCRVAGQRRYHRFKPGHPDGFLEAFANLYVDFAADLRAFSATGRHASEYVFGLDHAEDGLRMMEVIAESSRSHRWATL